MTILELQLNPLLPDAISIDERKIVDHLGFVGSYARLINYYNEANEHDGSWESIFLKEPTILLAAISKSHYVFYCHQFMLALSQLRDKSTPTDHLIAAVERIFDLAYSIMRDMQTWSQTANNHVAPYSFSAYNRCCPTPVIIAVRSVFRAADS